MNSEKRHSDDFKKLFESQPMPELPLALEDKVMSGIEIQKLKAKRGGLHWLNMNLVIFSLSVVLLVLLSVIHFVTDVKLLFFGNLQLLLLCSAGIFFILWVMEIIENALQNKFSKKVHPDFY